MATLKTSWLLSVLLVNLPKCFYLTVSPGPPVSPSAPECYIPCDEENCQVDIHCTWDPQQGPQIPTTYSLHWEPANSKERHVINGTSLNGHIGREHYSNHGELRVWVQAKNQYGSAKSQEVVFNSGDIIKPPPPEVTLSHQDPIEIQWTSTCNHMGLFLGLCDLRYRAEADQIWLEEDGFYGSYTFNSPQPCTDYEVQVRCACGRGLASNWSAIQRIQGTETTPIGELDVWMDCGIYPANFDCVLTWKRLPLSLACGLILGFEVRLSHNDGTEVLVNVSTAELRDQLVCDKMQCYFPSSIKNASLVSVSAYNAHGAALPSYITLPLSGKEKIGQALTLKMNEENLTVSWDLPSPHSDDLKQYVVQYKQAACPPGQAFDWVKVNRNQTTAIFKGHFKKYTPYQVSLFTISHSNKVHYLFSVIGYSLQRIPSRLPSFKVLSIDATHVTLLWEPVPLSKQDGLILYYQIGLEGQKELYNVSASPQHEHKTFELLHLSPEQEYEAWIRVVTAFGPGQKATTRFKTTPFGNFAYFSVLLGIMCPFVCVLLVIVSTCQGENKPCSLLPANYCDKVPDPRNSRIFREMKHQINDPIAWICIPIQDPHPKISLLEVVESQPKACKSSLEKTSDTDESTRLMDREGRSHMDCQEDHSEDAVTDKCQKTDHKYGREAYSKMIDSDDEREEDRRDCWSSSEEEQCTSGYEKHFMPTASDILEVL